MPIRDVAAQNASLDNDYGATAGPHAPVSHEVALFFGDPLEGGVELDATACPGYARVTVAQADWPAADGGGKSVTVEFPATSGEWTQTATHWGLCGADGAWWDCGELADVVTVTGAGAFDPVVVTVQYDNSLGLDF